MKQISNYKFYDMKDGTKSVDILGRKVVKDDGHIRVVAPDGSESILSEKDAGILYKKLYAAKIVDKLVDETLDELGFTVDNIHLTNYPVVNKFEKLFEAKLHKHNVDLSFISGVKTNKYGIPISGNALGINSSCIGWLWSHSWEKISLSDEALLDYLKKHPRINVYEKGQYVSVNKCDKKKLKGIDFGTSYSSRGIGSASSVVESTIELKKDKKGNLLIDRHSFVWD